jgi:N-acetylornithine carbamoyltransferase
MAMKRGEQNNRLEGKNIGMVFFNPSLRTRTSFEAAINDLGSHPIVLEVGQNVWNLEHKEGVVMDQDKPEHIKDAAPVLSGYLDALLVRSFPKLQNFDEDMSDAILESFRKYSKCPVINMESCLYHPCQSMADMMTMMECFPTVDDLRVAIVWSYHIKPLPIAVANSFTIICEQFGTDLTIAHPPGYDLPGTCNVRVTHSLEEALKGANVVYVKSWGSLEYYGRWDEEKKVREKYRSWMIDKSKMEATDSAILMHCMPFRRNVEIADDAADSQYSVLYEEALNRYYVQKALLYGILA